MAHYGWTLDYITWGIPWNLLQRMQIDAPGYKKSPAGEQDEEPVRLTAENAQEIISRINARN